MTSTPRDGVDEQAEFSKAVSILDELLGLPKIQRVLLKEECPNAARIYGKLSTLWLLIIQRLGGGLTLSQAVSELVKHHTDLLPKNKRVREGTLSENTAAYSRARKDLPLEQVLLFAKSMCDHLASLAPFAFMGKRVFIVDGTTITLPTTVDLKHEYPPATNQFGDSVWPIISMLVAHDMQTGCALVPKFAAKYGPNNSSESAMAREIVTELPANSIVLADSGFGIFSMAHHCTSKGQRFAFRLSNQRFKSMVKAARCVEDEEDHKTYHLLWQPSTKDQESTPGTSKETKLEVFLHETALPDGTSLYMLTNLEADAVSLSKLYQRRYDIEFDIRDIKVSMNTEQIRAKSKDTMMKELLGSIIAYNLVVQFRKQAANLIRIEPRKLSFSGVWLTFQDHLLRSSANSLDEWRETYTKALISASRRLLPNRKNPRNYPRTAHPRRQKSTKSEKKQRSKSQQIESPPTPKLE